MAKYEEVFEKIKNTEDSETINDFLIELGNDTREEYLSYLEYFMKNCKPSTIDNIKINLIYVLGQIAKNRNVPDMYIDYLYECASFAEEVHNNAEARGIRSAFVALFFSEENTGHAINAFHTTDKGLVYIDCSMGTDTVAYIEEDKEYGIVPLQMASSFDYSFYTSYKRMNVLITRQLYGTSQIVDLMFIYW